MNRCLLNSFLVKLQASSLEINLENFFYSYFNDFRNTLIGPILQDPATFFVKKVNRLQKTNLHCHL